jgi:NO-binding membrane sensor protein with MHYT domain
VVTVHNFSYGLLNPVLGYGVSCLGAFLGLCCITRARAHTGGRRAGWLVLAAVAVGATGVWAMHFIAMLGFTIPGQTILYNVPLTIGSMLLAIVVVGIGLFIVCYGDGSRRRLVAGGAIVGLGVASMHYIGMAAMSMTDSMSYNPALFAASVVIAVVAGTVALWLGTWVHRWEATLAGALIMGIAVSGMHYTGMAAMRVSAGMGTGMTATGASGSSFLFPLVVGISVVSLILTLIISLSPTEEEIQLDFHLQRQLAELDRRRSEQGQRQAPSPWSRDSRG